LIAKHKQLSLADLFDNVQDFYQNDKPHFLSLLEQYIDLNQLVPSSFADSYYSYYGRKRSYSLNSMLAFFIIQKILGIPHISMMINIFKLSSDLRDYCGFESIPDQAQFTRFKQNFSFELEHLFYHLVELTEPILDKINHELADCLIYDTSGIEAYVTENNPKFLNYTIKSMKKYYKNKPDIDIYKMAYSTLPDSANSNNNIKHLYINGHFCYAYKFGILTNGLGIVRHLAFLDDNFKNDHTELYQNNKSDSPEKDKSIGDSTSLKPVINDFFQLHPDFKYDSFIGDSAFDSYQNYSFLLNNHSFNKAVIPLNTRNSKTSLPKGQYDENGWPTCPYDTSLSMKPDGWSYEKGRSPRHKFRCPKMQYKKGKEFLACDNPCTDSKYGRVIYTYPHQNFRTYPGIIRGTKQWDDFYKKRGVVEQTINYFKQPMAIGQPKTQNDKTIKSDLFLAGITQLLSVILADKMHNNKILTLKSLIA
jgi:hypothetical protein